jgi:predicted O-methyltransferase YrrM
MINIENINDDILKIINDLNKIQYSVDEKKQYGGWKIEYDTFYFLDNLINKIQPNVVLEFGSGLSTKLFASHIEKGNIKELLSIDHLSDFPDHPKTLISDKSIISKIHFFTFPIFIKKYAKKFFCFYSIPFNFFANKKQIDLVFIDGPPYYYNGREAALHSCFEHLSSNAIIILDDANRINYERVYIKNWKYRYGDNLDIRLFEKEFKKGMCLIIKNNKKIDLRNYALLDQINFSISTLIRSMKLFIGKILKR